MTLVLTSTNDYLLALTKTKNINFAKSLQTPQNLCRPLKTFACVSLRYRKRSWVGGGNIGSVCSKMCGKMCGKIETLLG